MNTRALVDMVFFVVIVSVFQTMFNTCAADAQAPMRGPTGEEGVWLPPLVWRDTLRAYERAPALERSLSLCERSLELRTAAGVELRAALEDATHEAHEARAALDLTREARDSARRRARRRLGLSLGGSVVGFVLGLVAGFTAH